MQKIFMKLNFNESQISEFKQIRKDEYIKWFSAFLNHFNEKKGVICYHFDNIPFPPLAFSYVPKRGSSL